MENGGARMKKQASERNRDFDFNKIEQRPRTYTGHVDETTQNAAHKHTESQTQSCNM